MLDIAYKLGAQAALDDVSAETNTPAAMLAEAVKELEDPVEVDATHDTSDKAQGDVTTNVSWGSKQNLRSPVPG